MVENLTLNLAGALALAASGLRSAGSTGAAEGKNQGGENTHLFCPTGFLDDTWFHRTYWLYARTWGSGWCGYYVAGQHAPAGKIICADDEQVYVFGENDAGKKKSFTGQKSAYTLSYRLNRKRIVVPEVFIPDTPGDWADPEHRRSKVVIEKLKER